MNKAPGSRLPSGKRFKETLLVGTWFSMALPADGLQLCFPSFSWEKCMIEEMISLIVFSVAELIRLVTGLINLL